MPETSLSHNIKTLQARLDGLGRTLDGHDGDGNTFCLLDKAKSISGSIDERFRVFERELNNHTAIIFRFDAADGVADIQGVFRKLSREIRTPPELALRNFCGLVESADEAILKGLAAYLHEILDLVRGLSERLGDESAKAINELSEQTRGLKSLLEGPEAQRIRQWEQNARELNGFIAEQSDKDGDHSEGQTQGIRRVLDSILKLPDIERAEEITGFLDDLQKETFDNTVNRLSSAVDATLIAYSDACTLIKVSPDEFREGAKKVDKAVRQLKPQIRSVNKALDVLVGSSLLQSDALENMLREYMETALEGCQRCFDAYRNPLSFGFAQDRSNSPTTGGENIVPSPSESVHQTSVDRTLEGLSPASPNISESFHELFEKLDGAIDGIVISELHIHFNQIGNAVEQARLPSMSGSLKERVGPAGQSARDLQYGVVSLLSDVERFYEELKCHLRESANSVGEFESDGTFRYILLAELEDTLESGRIAVAGHPENADASGVSGLLKELHSSVNRAFTEFEQALEEVEGAIEVARGEAISGIEDFAAYLEGLNLTELVHRLQQGVTKILGGLSSIDFYLIVTPIVSEIEGRAKKLRGIDPELLNDISLQVLRVSLSSTPNVNFDTELVKPLRDNFESIVQPSRQAINGLCDDYNRAIALLDGLRPERLLREPCSSFEAIEGALGSINLNSHIQSLDQSYYERIQRPLARLQPYTLLESASESFRSFAKTSGEIRGDKIIEKVGSRVDDLKTGVLGLDVNALVDDIESAVKKLKRDVRKARPSRIVLPFAAEFEEIEWALEEFRPSAIFASASETFQGLAKLAEDEGISEHLTQAHQSQMQVLDRLQPQALTEEIKGRVDDILAKLDSADLAAKYLQIKGAYFDIKRRAAAQGDERLAEMVEQLDPRAHVGDLMNTYTRQLAALGEAVRNVELSGLSDSYAAMRRRVQDVLPMQIGKASGESFLRRFASESFTDEIVDELEQKFETFRQKLASINLKNASIELDSKYEPVLAQVDAIDLDEALARARETFDNVKSALEAVRVDFVASDVDNAFGNVREAMNALDPSAQLVRLDALHRELEQIVLDSRPSVGLSNLQASLARVHAALQKIGPDVALMPALNAAWGPVLEQLKGSSIPEVLSPLLERLDELEDEFEASLGSVETAFRQLTAETMRILHGDMVYAQKA